MDGIELDLVEDADEPHQLKCNESKDFLKFYGGNEDNQKNSEK